MSRTLVLLLATMALATPAVAGADVRLTSDVMRLSLHRMGGEPIARRMLELPRGRALDETPIFRTVKVDALFWHFEVKQPTLAQAVLLGRTEPAQREDALASSAPAGKFDRGPAAVRSRMLRLPRVRF